MKKILVAFLFVLTFSLGASAAVKDFAHFSADVPDGWTAQADGSVVAFLAPGNAAALSIAYDKTGGMAGDALAKAMSQALKGSAPQTVDKDQFTFEFTQNGVKSTCFMAVEGDTYVMFTITDPSGKFQTQIDGIIDSLEEKK